MEIILVIIRLDVHNSDYVQVSYNYICNEESEKFRSICSFIDNSRAVQGQTPARQNGRG